MQLDSITDRDNNPIGITIKYTGEPDYVIINVYCNRNEFFQWDETYMKHTDTDGHKYFEMTMTSKSGCVVITTD